MSTENSSPEQTYAAKIAEVLKDLPSDFNRLQVLDKCMRNIRKDEIEIVKISRTELEARIAILADRNQQYGDSWKWMDVTDVLGYIKDKAMRVRSGKMSQELAIEQLRDIGNYCDIAIELLRRQKQ